MPSSFRASFLFFVTAIFLPLAVLAAQEKSAPNQEKAAAKAESAKADRGGTEEETGDYQIQPMDMLRIQIYQEPDLSRELRVSKEGMVELPLIRSVDLKGKTVQQAEQLIRSLYDADFLVNPQVNITVMEYAPRSVQVFGQVNNPGVVYFPKEEGLTLTKAISLANSFTRLANKKLVTLRRTMPDGEIKTFTINVEDLMKGESRETWPLQPGDVIFVPERII